MLRSLLTPLSWLYRCVVGARNRAFDAGRREIVRVGVPVISVGNLTTGGTGKTPMVIDLARRLAGMGRRPAILTRGYGAAHGETPDEVAEINLLLPGVPVIVNADRVAGAREAIAAHAADCLLLDDGFQHRRIHRDLDIVLIDALNPWGGARLLPAGRLREPIRNLRRCDVIIVTRANQASGLLQKIRANAKARFVGPLLMSQVQPVGLFDRSGGVVSPLTITNPVAVLAGVGNVSSFLRTASDMGLPLGAKFAFPDHHRYGEKEVSSVLADVRQRGIHTIVTTGKDWVKLIKLWPSDCEVELLRLEMKIEISDSDGELDRALRKALEPASASAPD